MDRITTTFAGLGCVPALGLIGSSGGAVYSATQIVHYLARSMFFLIASPCLSNGKQNFFYTLQSLGIHCLAMVLHVINIATLTLLSSLIPLCLMKKNRNAIPPEFRAPLRSRPVDFSIGHPPSTKTRLNQIFTLFKKIIIFPWGTYSLIRYLTQRAIMSIAYPAQSSIFKIPIVQFLRSSHPKNFFINIDKQKATAKRVILERDGIRYEGVSLTHSNTVQNKNWVLYALGNGCTMESISGKEMKWLFKAGFNILSINGPGIGNSEGTAVPKTLGLVQELGMRYLEEKVKAETIVLAGYSFGGATMSEAILSHKFKQRIFYLALRIFTFDTLSNVAKDIIKLPASFIKKLLLWTDCETGSLEASKKLTQLNIQEVVYQGGRDGLIRQAVSLASHMPTRTITLPRATHTDFAKAIKHFSIEVLEADTKLSTGTLV